MRLVQLFHGKPERVCFLELWQLTKSYFSFPGEERVSSETLQEFSLALNTLYTSTTVDQIDHNPQPGKEAQYWKHQNNTKTL